MNSLDFLPSFSIELNNMQTIHTAVPKLLLKRKVRKYPRHALSSQRGSGQTLRGVMVKAHQTRKKLLRENPYAYIDHSA